MKKLTIIAVLAMFTSTALAEWQLFRTVEIGTGAKADPYRSALSRYIVADGTMDYSDWINAARHVRYAVAFAPPAVLAQCRSDADITSISPEVATVEDLNGVLEGDFSEDVSTVGTILEADGCSVAWTSVGTKRRHVLRYLSKLHVIGQEMKRVGNVNALAFLARNLDTTRSQLTAAQRNAILAWMESKGLSAAWTNANTTVREFLQYIIANVEWPQLNLGPLDLSLP